MQPIPAALQQPNALAFSHMGFYVRDLARMARFYKEVMCFTETDRGDLGPVQLIFLVATRLSTIRWSWPPGGPPMCRSASSTKCRFACPTWPR